MKKFLSLGGILLVTSVAAACSSSSDSSAQLSPGTADALPSAERPLLSQTGLYTDIAAKVLAPDVQEYAPAYALWSDDAHKTRWIRIPKGARIDWVEFSS